MKYHISHVANFVEQYYLRKFENVKAHTKLHI